jgi:hypothetical protein
VQIRQKFQKTHSEVRIQGKKKVRKMRFELFNQWLIKSEYWERGKSHAGEENFPFLTRDIE